MGLRGAKWGQPDRTEMRTARAIRKRDALLELFPFNRPVKPAIRAVWPIVSQDEVLAWSQFKDGKTLAWKRIYPLGNVGFQQDFSVNKNVAQP